MNFKVPFLVFNFPLLLLQVFYSMAPTPDMEEWQQLQTSVTHSAELQNLEQHAEYGIKVAARTSQVLSAVNLGRFIVWS